MTGHATTITLSAEGAIRAITGPTDPQVGQLLVPGRPFADVAGVFAPAERARFGALVDLLAGHPGLGGALRLLLDRPGQPGVELEIEPEDLVESSRTIRWTSINGDAAMLPVAATWPPLVRALPVPAALAGAGGAIRAVNDALCELLGRDDDALVGMRWAGLAVPPDDELAAAAHDALVDGLLDEASAHLRLFHPGLGVIEVIDRQIAVPAGVLSLVSALPAHSGPGGLLAGSVSALTGGDAMPTGSPGFSPELTFRAFHDPLTGLPNRLLLLDRLEHALQRRGRRADEIAVLFCDLDGFKEVNDTLGHDAGDRLLVTVGDRLRSVLRPSDTVARYGGDEFVLVCEDLHEGPSVADIARRVAASIERPIELDGHVTTVRVSIGTALAPEGLHDPGTLIRLADEDMYRVKDARKTGRPTLVGGGVTAAPGTRTDAVDETELAQAIDQGQLFALYLPQIDLTNGRLTALEALVRWAHPRRGTLGPDRFLAMAERSGQITDIGRVILTAACAAGARWLDIAREAGGVPPMISVNVSRSELANTALVDVIRDALRSSGLTASLLRLDVSAATVQADPVIAERVFADLRALGVSVAVDDVGAELADLDALGELLPAEVKLDRPWVQALGQGRTEGRSTGSAVAGFARLHRIAAAAEGVETEEEARQLGQQGFVSAQGFWFAPPQTEASITLMIASDLRWRIAGDLRPA